MKVKFFIWMLCIVSIFLVSCFGAGDKVGSETLSDESNEVMIKLEQKLDSLIKEQNKANEENRILFDKLYAELESLKVDQKLPSETSPAPNTAKFTYNVKNGKAEITGYSGSESNIVIPARIDGYVVESIGENAFSNSRITSVIISEGVKKIDWFSFYMIPTLEVAIIPSSIEEIGYSAFDGASSSFSIHCHSGSYAFSYAKSYGISYVII